MRVESSVASCSHVDLEVLNIGKSFQGKRVLDGVSLAVTRGEFVAVLGPSGSGKSTLLKLVAGFEQPDIGTVRLQGRDVTRTAPYQRNINTVFQNYALFPHMDVFENVAYGLRRKKVGGTELDRRVQEALALVGLASFGQRVPETLSGGEQQRVAIARALVNRPAVLLLDEPLSALDLKIRRRMQGELKRIHEEVGTTFIYVTHDQEEAMALGHRIVVMRDGSFEQVGTGRDLYDRPVSHFVADFIGETNWLTGRLRSVEGGIAVSTLADGSLVRAPAKDGMRPGIGVEIGVRPERLRLHRDAVASGSANSVAAQVERTVFQGASLTIDLRLRSDQRWRYVRQIEGPRSDGDDISPGSEVVLAWDVASTFLFASESPGSRCDESRMLKSATNR
jgi:spermidine/putrescine transport system ATP-binding protein